MFSYPDGVERDLGKLSPLPLDGSPNARAILTRRPVLVDDDQDATTGPVNGCVTIVFPPGLDGGWWVVVHAPATAGDVC